MDKSESETRYDYTIITKLDQRHASHLCDKAVNPVVHMTNIHQTLDTEAGFVEMLIEMLFLQYFFKSRKHAESDVRISEGVCKKEISQGRKDKDACRIETQSTCETVSVTYIEVI